MRVQTLPRVSWISLSQTSIKILIDHSCLIFQKISCLIRAESGPSSNSNSDITNLVKQRLRVEQMADINNSHMLVTSVAEFKLNSKLH